MEDLAGMPLHHLAATAADNLARYEALPQDEKDPELMRAAAQRIIAAREHFTNTEGKPDLRGSSYGYRMWLGNVYATAGITTVEHKVRVGNRLRWWTNAAVHERFSPEQLIEYGMTPGTLRARGSQRRRARTELVELFRPGQPFTPDQTAEAAELITVSLKRMAALPRSKQDRAELIDNLAQAEALIGQLLQRL